MEKLDGKIAFTTGGSEGIGLATVQEFVNEGAYVFITGKRKEALDAAVKQIGNKNITAIQGDVAKLDELDKVIEVIKNEKGKLHILLANAAILSFVPIRSITEQSFDDQFNVNVKGVLFTLQKASPIFVDGGWIVLVGSGLSIKGFHGGTVCSATKAAVRSFARCWTVDLKERKTRVNTLSPGPTDTPMVRSAGGTKEGAEKFINSIIADSIMGRIGQPSEIAKVAVFLGSDDSSYITGIELFADGGWSRI